MKSMNTTMSLLLLVIVLLTRSLSQEYKPSAFAIQPVLTPRVPQPQAQTPPGFSQTAPAPPPAPAPAPAPASASALVPAPDPAPAADSSPSSSPEEPRRTLGTAGKDILRKFDDYLFKNLEDAYYRLTYAFEDAAKRALEDCGCHVGDSSNTTPVTAPPA